MSSPIPPYEPPPGADPDVRTSMKALHDEIAALRSETKALHRRSRWISLFAFAAMVGACSGHTAGGDYGGQLSQLESQVQELQSDVTTLVEQNKELRESRSATDHKPSVKPS